MTNSPRARTLINLSAVLYEQSAARLSLSAEVGNIDLDFVPGVAFIPDVHIADSLRARTPINLSTVLPRARTLINPSTVLYEQERTASPAKRIKTDKNCKKSTHRDDDNVQLVRDNIEELIYVSKVKHTYVLFRRARNNRNNLNIIVTDPTGREFGRVNIKSSTRFKFYKGKNIQLLRPVFKLQRYDYYNSQDRLIPREPGSIYVLRSVDEIQANIANVFDTVISKSDKVPTRELSSHIKTELYPHQKQALYFMLRDNSHKFYRLVITSEDTHCKQTIKKAYIMSPERALLILFIT
ncbi:hypothetical protein HBI37_195600 [Parastagonospora nodorum]|nr:hypothetical protein HBI37_195600 [Parastagonospora nodorum]